VEAISNTVEKGLLTSDVVGAVIETFPSGTVASKGQGRGQAWVDDAYRARLLADGTQAIGELGFGGAEGEHLVVLENTPQVHNVVVCTLCSCYPWPVLGLPPRWYNSPAYRSRAVREPRAVMAEFGTTVPDDAQVRVWDSSAEIRYMVLPCARRELRPVRGRLVPLVTRTTIGTPGDDGSCRTASPGQRRAGVRRPMGEPRRPGRPYLDTRGEDWRFRHHLMAAVADPVPRPLLRGVGHR
jgi:nitrile hydratase